MVHLARVGGSYNALYTLLRIRCLGLRFMFPLDIVCIHKVDVGRKHESSCRWQYTV